MDKCAQSDLVSVQAHLLAKLRRTAGGSQDQVVVRFWIMTMMLVGLSTLLKLR